MEKKSYINELGLGGVWGGEELIASLGLLSPPFHRDHKLLHIAAFSGQEGAPRAFPFFFVQNSSFCLFFPLTPSLCSHAFKLIYPSFDRVI